MISAVFRHWDLGVPVMSLCASRNGEWILASLADGSARIFAANAEAKEPRSLALHEGLPLCLRPDADDHAFLSGGEDGKVLIVDPVLGAATLLAEHAVQRIEQVAASPQSQCRAYSVAQAVHVLNEAGEEKVDPPLLFPGSIKGLAFSPKGDRLAVGYPGGVALWQTDGEDTQPTTLKLKDSPCGLLWSPDGAMLLACLMDNEVCAWLMPEEKEIRLRSFAAPVHSMAFTAGNKYLAASGAAQILYWPTAAGRFGKEPLRLGEADQRLVTVVAAHAKEPFVAAGYDDGMVAMAPLDGRKALRIRPPGLSPINGLALNKAGDCLFASVESGTILLFTVDSLRNALAPHD